MQNKQQQNFVDTTLPGEKITLDIVIQL